MPHRRIYMDSNATTPVLPAVLEAMHPFWSERFGNASAVHEHGRSARAAVDGARESIGTLVGARALEITFTSGGTESDNLALFGTLKPGDHLITAQTEHHAVLHAAEALLAQGVQLTALAPDSDGIVSADAVRDAMQANTKLVSLMLANNETGLLQPLAEIASVVHAGGALLHTDAVQACGKLPVDVRALGCDLLSLSAHKMHGPLGAGALWVRRGVDLRSMLHGGPQERKRRAGTENLPAIVGFAAAADATSAWLRDSGPQRLCEFRTRLETALDARIAGTIIHGKAAPRLPNTTSVRFDGVDSEALVIALDLQGLAVSGGSACQSGAIEPSHVLLAMRLTDTEARSTIRISMSRLTTAEEIDTAVDLITHAVGRLRELHS